MRRTYLRAGVWVGLAFALVVAVAATVHAISHASGHTLWAGVPDPRGLDPGRSYDGFRLVPLKLSRAPWLELAGFVVALGAASWLGIASSVARRHAARELDRANRELARRAGDLVVPARPS